MYIRADKFICVQQSESLTRFESNSSEAGEHIELQDLSIDGWNVEVGRVPLPMLPIPLLSKIPYKVTILNRILKN